MPVPSKSIIPKLRKHPKGSVVVLDGKYCYCGPHGSAEASEKYDRLVAEWLASGRRLPARQPQPTALTVSDLLLHYWHFVQGYYVKENEPTSEQDTIRQALRFVRRLYGSTFAQDFGPLALKTVRDAMIEHGWCRRYINKQVGRVKRMFAWAVEQELVSAEVHRALSCVAGLRMNKTTAREKPSIKPVSEADVQAVLPLLPRTVRTMVLVQRLSSGRPQDVIEMKPCDIDRQGTVWEYRPGRHKSEHHERERIVFLGPRAQALLGPLLDGLRPDEYVFSPIRSEKARRADVRKRRGLPPLQGFQEPGNGRLRDHYDGDSYRRAIRRACVKANVPIWCPLQLRHTAGTEIRRRYGLEASQAVLGHAELSVTQVYSEVDLETGRRIIAEIG